jgi:hypothetical protein
MPLQGVQLGHDIGHLARRMFGVDEDPIEPAAGEEFGQRRAVQRGEQPDLLIAEPFLERISRGSHHASIDKIIIIRSDVGRWNPGSATGSAG